MTSRAERDDLEGAAGVSMRQADQDDAEAAALEAEADEDAEIRPRRPAARPEAADPAAGWEFDIPAAVARYLKPDETRIIPVRPHVIRLALPALAFGGGLAAAVALNGWAYSAGYARPAVVHTIWIAWTAGALWAAYRYAEWRQTWFAVTGHRLMLIQAKHLIGRDVTMLPLAKLRDLAYRQSPLGRLFGYATFDFASIGTEKALDLVPWLPQPEWLYQRVSELTMPSDEGKVIKRRT